MTEDIENLPDVEKELSPPDNYPPAPTRVRQYRRDLFPINLVLSADDLREFCELLSEANERAKEIEFNKLDLSLFDSADHARQRLDEVVIIECLYVAANGDSDRRPGIPTTNERTFPDDLKSFFVSNTAFSRRVVKFEPLNLVEAFFGFDKPSLKIDFNTLPSNPTENRSVINIIGGDEDWVISTTERIETFLKSRSTKRPVLHGSGTYDYFVYLLFLPAMFWAFYKLGTVPASWLEQQPVFLNVTLGVYALLLSLLFGRFVFQYARWLFPPMEYYKRSRWTSYIHRTIASAIGTTIVLSAIYELLKALFIS